MVIPVVLLQKCSPELSPVLAKLFKKCFSDSCFPSCRKCPSVIPVFKNSGERFSPCNYGPISILPVLSKIFDIVINSSLAHQTVVWMGYYYTVFEAMVLKLCTGYIVHIKKYCVKIFSTYSALT